MAIKQKAVFKDKKKPEHASNYHKDGHKLAILTSGKKLVFRQAKMKDQKKASRFAHVGQDYNSINFAMELLRILLLKVYRANGDEIKIDGLDVMEDVLCIKEANELLLLSDQVLDVTYQKKTCAVVI